MTCDCPPECVCCGLAGAANLPYEDRHGDRWCLWCHDNGDCDPNDGGHREEPK